MTNDLAGPHRWLARRWWVLIILVFATQLGLIFWLGKPTPAISLFEIAAPSFRLMETNAQRMLAFKDPTLFALPHWEGFSGAAWLTIPEQDFKPVFGAEPPHLLTLSQERLGDEFQSYMATNQGIGMPVIALPDFKLKDPEVTESALFPTNSRLRLTGALTGRHLTFAPALPSVASLEIVSNSVVGVLVAADGTTISPSLLNPGSSGSSEADQLAITAARKIRFESIPTIDPLNPMAGITWGQIVFEWHTAPLRNTNKGVESERPK
jgi:hypothetical protein